MSDEPLEQKELPIPQIEESLPAHFLGQDNPRSMYNLSPKSFQDALERIHGSYLLMDEDSLEEKVKPTPTLNCLRLKLWDEYQRAMETKTRIDMKRVCAGLCTEHYMRRAVFRNPIMTAWLALPPRQYEVSTNESLLLGIKRLRKILDFPLYNTKGRPDKEIARIILSVTKFLNDSVRGAPTQEIRNKSISVSVSAQDIQEIKENMNMDELERKLGKLRGEEEKHELLEESRPKLKEFKSREIDITPEKPKKPLKPMKEEV